VAHADPEPLQAVLAVRTSWKLLSTQLGYEGGVQLLFADIGGGKCSLGTAIRFVSHRCALGKGEQVEQATAAHAELPPIPSIALRDANAMLVKVSSCGRLLWLLMLLLVLVLRVAVVAVAVLLFSSRPGAAPTLRALTLTPRCRFPRARRFQGSPPSGWCRSRPKCGLSGVRNHRQLRRRSLRTRSTT